MIILALQFLLALISLVLITGYFGKVRRAKFFTDLPNRLWIYLRVLLRRPEEMSVTRTLKGSYFMDIEGDQVMNFRDKEVKDGKLGKLQLPPDSFAILSIEDELSDKEKKVIGSQSQLLFLQSQENAHTAEVLPYCQMLQYRYTNIQSAENYPNNSGYVSYSVRFPSDLDSIDLEKIADFRTLKGRIETHIQNVLETEFPEKLRSDLSIVDDILDSLNDNHFDFPFEVQFTAVTVDPQMAILKGKQAESFNKMTKERYSSIAEETRVARNTANQLVRKAKKLTDQLLTAFDDLREIYIDQKKREEILKAKEKPVKDAILGAFLFYQDKNSPGHENGGSKEDSEAFAARLIDVKEAIEELQRFNSKPGVPNATRKIESN